MSNFGYARINIGGKITESQVEDIKDMCEVFKVTITENQFYVEDEEQESGEFPELERYCRSKRIPFIRHSDGTSNYLPEMSVSMPGIEETHITDQDGYPLVRGGPLTNLVIVLDMTLESAPHYINSHLGIVSTYAKGLLSGEPPYTLDQVKNLLKKIAPQLIPPLPPFEIIDG